MTYTILTEIEDHDTIIRYPAITGVAEDEASGIQANIKARARENYPGSTVTVKAIEEK